MTEGRLRIGMIFRHAPRLARAVLEPDNQEGAQRAGSHTA